MSLITQSGEDSGHWNILSLCYVTNFHKLIMYHWNMETMKQWNNETMKQWYNETLKQWYNETMKQWNNLFMIQIIEYLLLNYKYRKTK